VTDTAWPWAPLKLIARLGTGHTPSRQHPEYWEECTVPWLTLADVWQLRDGTVSTIRETAEKVSELGLMHSAAVRHPKGTVALSRTASVGFSCILGRDMATSQDFATWRCGPRLHNRFLLWSLRGLRDQILGLRMGSTHQTIYMPDIESIRIPLPPLAAQRAIADFLDAETARIDALVAKRARLISALLERREAVTALGVSGALTSDGQETTSVPWIGHKGKGWDEARLSLVADLGTGHTPSREHPEWWTDCTIPWITTGEVARMRSDRTEVITETREQISEAGLANSSAVLHPAGTVVLCRTASAGYSAIMGTDMATSQDFAAWTCGPLLRPRFLLLQLRAMRQDLLGRLAMGSTHKTIYMPDIESFKVLLPPVEEQDRIVSEVWRRLHAIDHAIDKLNRQIALLQERRRALITAAVTGPMETPGVAA
jgi:type I restriction enzyme S subunit